MASGLLPWVGPEAEQQPFELESVEHIGVLAVAVFGHIFFVVEVVSCGDDNGADFFLDDLGFHVVIDGFGLADIGTLAAGDRERDRGNS